MNKALLSILLFMLLSVSCSKKSSVPEEQRTVGYFTTYLKPGMDFPAITNKFGPPDADNGSGIHIYIYKLKDSTAIWIGYTDRIMYARHVDSNNQVISVII